MEGCNVLTLCELGDRLILEETGKVYKKEKEMKKGRENFVCNMTGLCGSVCCNLLLNLSPISLLATRRNKIKYLLYVCY